MDDKQLEMIIEAIRDQHQCIMKEEVEKLKKQLALYELIRSILTPRMVFALTACAILIISALK